MPYTKFLNPIYNQQPLNIPDHHIDDFLKESLIFTTMLIRPQIALLKILLAAAPTSKAKSETINVLADVLPEEMP